MSILRQRHLILYIVTFILLLFTFIVVFVGSSRDLDREESLLEGEHCFIDEMSGKLVRNHFIIRDYNHIILKTF